MKSGHEVDEWSASKLREQRDNTAGSSGPKRQHETVDAAAHVCLRREGSGGINGRHRREKEGKEGLRCFRHFGAAVLAGLSEKRDPTRGGLAKRTRRHRPTGSCQTVRQSPKQRPCLDSTGKTVAGRAGRPIVAASPAVHLNLFLTRLRRVPFSRSVSRDRFDKSNLTSGRKRAQDKGARRKRQTRRKMEVRTWPHFAVGKVAVACSSDRWISLVHTLSLPVEESGRLGSLLCLARPAAMAGKNEEVAEG